MADKVKASQSCPPPDKYPWLKGDMRSTPDIDCLATSMQRLRAQSITDQRPDPKDMLFVSPYGEEHLKVKLIAEEARRHKKSFGKMKEFSTSPENNLDQASHFIARHEASLLKGKLTDPTLAEKVLLDLQSGTHETDPSLEEEYAEIVSHAEITDELRYLAENTPAMVLDLQRLFSRERLEEESVVNFFSRYAEFYSKAEPALLLQAAETMMQEIREKLDQEKKMEQLREKARKDFVEAYRQYHEMIRSGASTTEAMEKVKLGKDKVERHEDTMTPADRAHAEVFVESTESHHMPAVSKKRDSGISLREPSIDDPSSDIEMEDDAKISMHYRGEQKRGRRNSAANPDTKEDKVSQRTPAKSPEKRRTSSTGSIERARSPTKKARGTRGVAQIVKNGKKSAFVRTVKSLPDIAADNEMRGTDDTLESRSDIDDHPVIHTAVKKAPRRQAKHGRSCKGIARKG